MSLTVDQLQRMYVAAAKRLYVRDIELQRRILINNLAKKLNWTVDQVENIWDANDKG